MKTEEYRRRGRRFISKVEQEEVDLREKYIEKLNDDFQYINYRQPDWIGTYGVNWNTGLEPGVTQRQNVSPGSSPASRFIASFPIHPG